MEELKDEVYKCSKCGQCRSVCPVFLATKNEMFSPRGRFITLNNYFNNNAKLSKEFINNLDICLNCNLCKSFCPSNIDSVNIYTHLKNKYKVGCTTKISKKLLPVIKIISKIFPFGIFKTKIKREKIEITDKKARIAYFQGCYNQYVNQTDKNAALNLLEKYGYEIAAVLDECCGYSMVCDGDLEAFKNNAQEIIKDIPSDAQYIVCSCDSCYETLKRIPEISEKLIAIDNLLQIKTDDALYYKPVIRQDAFLQGINTKGECTLLENFFMIKHPLLAKKISKNLPAPLINNDIVTTCQITKAGLEHKYKKKVYTYAEYLWNKAEK
ncbi:(Fe-S)-binding protein [bacterium]|nr:(Fe-S)-binding protein [bacterium]